MRFYNLNDKTESVSFTEATLKGLGSQGGLYFPQQLPYFDDIDTLLTLDFVSRSIVIAKRLLGDELSEATIEEVVTNALSFPLALTKIEPDVHVLELVHGPTLSFKDFGARFMAQLLATFENDRDPITILTATSGDTGAAVAHAFQGVPNVQVVILYPEGRISALQEKMFCTLGGNIHTLAIQGTFDDCQRLVKECFNHADLAKKLGLNSANSINISRLIAQCFYYFEAVAQLPSRDHIVVSVPCGNFGNLTAGLMAQQMGLPIQSFVVATNANDTVPRYLHTDHWDVKPTVATITNAMDVSAPSNWPRVEELFKLRGKVPQNELLSVAFNDDQTRTAIKDLSQFNLIADPHTAIAYAGLKVFLKPHQQGIFLSTAHPAKFKETVESVLQQSITMPSEITDVIAKPILSKTMPADFSLIKNYLISSMAIGSELP